jgi:tetratricopeptide (TPR) repeat protein
MGPQATEIVGASCLTGLLALATGCPPADDRQPLATDGGEAAAAYVGSGACAECHEREYAAWRGSDHDLAMDVATEQTVLGDFDDATLPWFGVTSTFFRRDGKYFVRTDGPDGKLRDYEIAYTFGVRPLQQYLVEFPGGRFQALSLCWDSRPASEGGQRWFHLYPDEAIRHDDPLHWTAPSQNWNYMCAECHSTNLRKGFVPEEDRYETTWSEIDVACEACHGPGSRHVAWAESAPNDPRRTDDSMGLVVQLDPHDGAEWLMNPETGIAMRSVLPASRVEIETCARCHSRRSALNDDYVHGRPLTDTHRPALLVPDLYHADGQILDEVYVYGSFLQSKMYGEGVTCSDCHDPHSLRVHGPGNVVCARCHLPTVFDTPSHHFHEQGTEAALCTSCHMVKRSYMVVDPRGDHSFRVPRPDLTEQIGVPNACNGCHGERSPQWAADVVAGWRGPEWSPDLHYGEILHAAREGLPEGQRGLLNLNGSKGHPAIVRATAVQMLRAYPRTDSVHSIERVAGDPSPLVRAAAMDAVEIGPPRDWVRIAAPLLDDPVRLVRTSAARVLAPVPPELMTPDQRAALDLALEEYRRDQHANADRPESHVNLGTLHAQRGEIEEAERAFETALRTDPHYIPAYVNYADLRRLTGRDDLGEELLRRALEQTDDGDVRHALGLTLIRLGKRREAMVELERAAELRPDNARYGYVLAIGLHELGDSSRAIEALETAHRNHPDDREILLALVTIGAESGATELAIGYAEKLVELSPQEVRWRQMLYELKKGSR